MMHYTWADGIAFSDQRILVPQSLQSQTLDLIHESHLGVEKSKSRAHQLLCWVQTLSVQ